MAKDSPQYTCDECGHVEAKWVGRCPGCEQYNSMQESAAPRKTGSVMGFAPSGTRRSTSQLQPQSLSSRSAPPKRATTGLAEFDRALGGGLVEASVVLIGGDPGIGKSTLLLQVAASMAAARKVVYFSGEESLNQIQLRATRLAVDRAPVDLIPTNDCLAIADYIERMPRGSVAIIDSIQVMNAGADSAPGSVSQVKLSAAHLIPAAKNADVSLILVSHVTKDGSLAGPNLLKHAVDATIYVEADTAAGLYRLVRTEKNRFGPANEVGVFEMTDRGMLDVKNPSEVFIAQRDPTAFGTVIYPSLEGTRPLLLEVQALVSVTTFGTGRRSATGWDSGRLNMLLATISARLGIELHDKDIYVNVAGGLKVTDPAMDLAVAMAILSANAQVAVPSDMAVFGEIGLAGEVRSSSRSEARIKEAAQLGFSSIICPVIREANSIPAKASCTQIKRLAQVMRACPELISVYGSKKAVAAE
jgi:DNA repair protein RadA/Sms